MHTRYSVVILERSWLAIRALSPEAKCSKFIPSDVMGKATLMLENP